MVANMRLLAGVGPGVDGQSAPLNEALVAILDRAMVGSLVGMYPIMATEVRLAIKRLEKKLGLSWRKAGEEGMGRHDWRGMER